MTIAHLVVHLGSTPSWADPALRHVVLMYIGPDQILPLTSALGAVVGVLLMFWQRFVVILRRTWQFVAKLRIGARQRNV